MNLRNISVTFFVIFIILYFIFSSMNYELKYRNNKLESDIQKKNQQIDEFLIKINTSSSKEEAKETTDLKFNDNVFYLEEENG